MADTVTGVGTTREWSFPLAYVPVSPAKIISTTDDLWSPSLHASFRLPPTSLAAFVQPLLPQKQPLPSFSTPAPPSFSLSAMLPPFISPIPATDSYSVGPLAVGKFKGDANGTALGLVVGGTLDFSSKNRWSIGAFVNWPKLGLSQSFAGWQMPEFKWPSL